MKGCVRDEELKRETETLHIVKLREMIIGASSIIIKNNKSYLFIKMLVFNALNIKIFNFLKNNCLMENANQCFKSNG